MEHRPTMTEIHAPPHDHTSALMNETCWERLPEPAATLIYFKANIY